MQNINKKWSILLWAIFLSTIISISFIYINTQITKNIKNNSEIWEIFSEQKDFLENIKSWTNTTLWEEKFLIFEDKKETVKVLKQNEKVSFLFSWSSNFNIDIWIIEWWAIFYNYANFPSSNNSWNSINSWVVEYLKSFSWTLDSTNNNWILKIENLSWYSKILIKSSIDFKWNTSNYKIIKKFWNTNLVEKRWKIKNFNESDYNILEN